MGSPTISLEEQHVDQRSKQVAYKISISGSKDERIRLLSLEPRIPSGSRLVEIIDTSIAEIDSRRKDISEELNSILQNIIWVSSESFRLNWIEVQKSSLRQAFTFSGIFRIYGEMLIPFAFGQNTFKKRIDREFRKMTYSISSVEDAVEGFDLWIKSLPETDNMRKLYTAKLSQLKLVESRAGRLEDTGIAEVDDSCPFTSTYVINFKRGIFEAKKYQIAFHVNYNTASDQSIKSTNVSQSIIISPSPISLSVITMLSAVLGTIIKLLISSEIRLHEIFNLLDNGNILIGPIVALIFFNIYEQTSIGRGMSLAVNWRSALLIGSLCGLAHERILEAMKALIGVQ